MPQYLHVPGKGDILHFHHANGFPAGVYQPILNELSQQFDVYALKGRATWDNTLPTYKNWHLLADDLIDFAECFDKPIIAVGHSLGGAVTTLAATRRPELFKAVVLIEPAMVSYPFSLFIKYSPKIITEKVKVISSTLNKKDSWDTQEEYLNYIKKFPAYKQFNEQTFEAFTQSAIKEDNDGRFNLVFPKRWEAHNYTMPSYLIPKLKQLDQLAVPTVAIRGKDNMLFPMRLWRHWQQAQKKAVFLKDQRFTHLFPFEDAKACTKLIVQGLEINNCC